MTTPASRHPLDEALVHEDELRLVWRRVDTLPASSYLAHDNEQNERFLRGLMAAEEHHEASEDAEAAHPEIQRLDAKLNLLLDLVGNLLVEQAQLPAPVPLRFNGYGIAWKTGEPLAPDSLVMLELYLRDSLPRPLCLHGRVVEFADGQATVAFEGLDEATRDGIEKYVFRQHRRRIARRRNN